ncbi:hypothetical protein GE061_017238 [Apolygus lucorum]|uniref:Globin family profile domain-containing protein n=1 Tax=Apolygus lucorum TaxID=248454 RepID=A0A8S9XAM5_APOLU|nr:hypothetical protein GE061_017238 [Apolygus lucorum]
MTSSQFRKWSLDQELEEGENEEDNDKIMTEPILLESDQVLPSPNNEPLFGAVGDVEPNAQPSALNVQSTDMSMPTLIFGDKWSKPSMSYQGNEAFSNETLLGSEYLPPHYAQHVKDLNSDREKKNKLGLTSEHPIPVLYMELKRFKGEEKFDAFSEDEEPVLRTEYTPYVPGEPECPKPVVREETITIYNVREGLHPFSTSKHKNEETELSRAVSTGLQSRPSLSRRNTRSPNVIPTMEWKNQDLTPHQRDLSNVSFEELSPAEVAIIKGLWKCITSNLWTFGALTTINFFRIRGHIGFSDQKATPEEIMRCRFLWPHANQAMKSMEAVVLNLHKPEESHKLVYELGKKHGKLKIPLNDTQSEMVINSFLYTFHQHVHPKMTLKEMNILRKLSRITMFQFMDASRWDSEPLPLY